MALLILIRILPWLLGMTVILFLGIRWRSIRKEHMVKAIGEVFKFSVVFLALVFAVLMLGVDVIFQHSFTTRELLFKFIEHLIEMVVIFYIIAVEHFIKKNGI